MTCSSSFSLIIFKLTLLPVFLFLFPSEKDGDSLLLKALIASMIVVFPELFAPTIKFKPEPDLIPSGREKLIDCSLAKPLRPDIVKFFIIRSP